MDKRTAIDLVIKRQAQRAAAVKDWTPETRAKWDALMAKMTAALEAQDQAWFDSFDDEINKMRGFGGSASSIYINAIGKLIQ